MDVEDADEDADEVAVLCLEDFLRVRLGGSGVKGGGAERGEDLGVSKEGVRFVGVLAETVRVGWGLRRVLPGAARLGWGVGGGVAEHELAGLIGTHEGTQEGNSSEELSSAVRIDIITEHSSLLVHQVLWWDYMSGICESWISQFMSTSPHFVVSSAVDMISETL